MKTVCIGTVGSGFVAQLHAEAYKKVSGIGVRLKAVTGTNIDNSRAFAERHGFEKVYATFDEMLADGEIDVIDICVPNVLHSRFAVLAAKAKKHIICEKPLLGFFEECKAGESEADYALRALEAVKNETETVKKAVHENGVRLMYAEDWVYAPPVRKAKELIAASKGSILDIRAEESHSGSHAAYTRHRATAGGGALLILGSHPIAAAIHLKNTEGLLKTGKKTGVKSVMASLARFNGEPVGSGGEKFFVANDWIDVENWATAVLTFTDGSKAVITDSFAKLGGVRNTMEVYLSNCVVKCNMTPNDTLNVYSPQQGIYDGVYLQEKLETNAGWNNINADEDWMRGYPQEIQDFIESAAFDREPVSGLDLAGDTITAIYAAYLSAATGRVVDL